MCSISKLLIKCLTVLGWNLGLALPRRGQAVHSDSPWALVHWAGWHTRSGGGVQGCPGGLSHWPPDLAGRCSSGRSAHLESGGCEMTDQDRMWSCPQSPDPPEGAGAGAASSQAPQHPPVQEQPCSPGRKSRAGGCSPASLLAHSAGPTSAAGLQPGPGVLRQEPATPCLEARRGLWKWGKLFGRRKGP